MKKTDHEWSYKLRDVCFSRDSSNKTVGRKKDNQIKDAIIDLQLTQPGTMK